MRQLPLGQQPNFLFLAPKIFALFVSSLKLSFFILGMFASACIFTCDNVVTTQTLSDLLQQNFLDSQAQKNFLQTANSHQESSLNTPVSEQKNSLKKVQPTQQSYAHAVIASTALGSLNTLGCFFLEQNLPLWWPINVVAARISCTLLLPSLVYAYLAFAEGHGITCHSSTMHSCAFIADWTTYLAIKKYR